MINHQDSVFVYKSTYPYKRYISSNSIFFNGENRYKVKVEYDKITFNKPPITYEGKTYNSKKGVDGWINFHIKCEFPLGKFDFDLDESDEDSVVIYFKDKDE
jgi:hypothetical protein